MFNFNNSTGYNHRQLKLASKVKCQFEWEVKDSEGHVCKCKMMKNHRRDHHLCHCGNTRRVTNQ